MHTHAHTGTHTHIHTHIHTHTYTHTYTHTHTHTYTTHHVKTHAHTHCVFSILIAYGCSSSPSESLDRMCGWLEDMGGGWERQIHV